MAQSIALTSGSPLIGSPIIVSVTADSVSSSATFHQVKLKVVAALSTDSVYTESILASPCKNGEVVTFDISSALRAAAAKYEHLRVSADTTYPYIKYVLSAWDDYMIEGYMYEKQNLVEYNSGATLYALFGAATDAERYYSGASMSVASFSRKPLTGEVCALGDLYVAPQSPSAPITLTSTITTGASIQVATLTTEGLQTVGGRTVYVDGNAQNRIQFQFVNGFGCVESASAETLPTVSNNGDSAIENISAPASFNRFARLSISKQSRQTAIKCSTGPVNQEWANWWINEFMGGDPFRNGGHGQCWVMRSGKWWPCIIIPDDDMKVVDGTKGDLISLEFEVRIAIGGAI